MAGSLAAELKTPMHAQSDRVDTLVVGGGVYGILLSLQGSARGQRVLLIERDDFGAGASSNHLRTIHGGLRYLQSLDIRRAVMSNRQRLWWLTQFPDLVQPISCLMPLYGEGTRRAGAFRAAFLTARLLGLNRDAAGRPGRMRVIPTAEVERLLPLCRREKLRCGALWQDAFIPWPDRLLAELLNWAREAGVSARNRTELESATPSGGAWRVSLRDLRSGDAAEVTAGRIVNAAGGAANEVVARVVGPAAAPVLVPTLAWGLLIARAPVAQCSVAVSPPGRGRRTYFLHPYHGRMLAGTGHAGVPAGGGVAPVTDAQVRSMLADLNEALPAVGFAAGEVEHVFQGVLPGIEPGAEALQKYPRITDHGRRDNAPGFFSVLGVKFTEAPFVAERFWNEIAGPRRRPLPPRPPGAGANRRETVRESLGAPERMD